jgi:hypothetical protein
LASLSSEFEDEVKGVVTLQPSERTDFDHAALASAGPP